MNCEQFREIVHDVARDEALGFATLHEAFEHADGCAECDALLEEAAALTASLRALAERDAVAEAPARVEAALLRAFRQSNAVARPTRRRLWAFAGFAGAAAVVLLVIVLMHGQKQVSRAASLMSDRASVAAIQSGDSLAVSEEEANLSLSSDPVVDFMDGWPVAYEDNTATGPFVPLSDTFDPTALDVNTVMRVSMSRPALQRLGVYLDGNGDGPVVADLVVAGDGTPQAIRVVQW